MAIHVAEEARHISFAHEYLRKRVPHLPRRKRFWLSIYVPIVMRVLCSAIMVPPRSFWKEFDIPRSVRKEHVLPLARVPADAAGHVRRRPDAVPRHRADEPDREADLADVQDRRCAQPLPQRAAAPARGRRVSQESHAPCDHPVVLQRRVLRLRLPGELHSSVAGRAGLRHRRDALHRSRLRVWTAAPASRPARSGRSPPTPSWNPSSCRSSRSTPPSIRSADEKLPPTSKLAPVIEAPEVQPGGWPADGRDRRLRSGGDVCRRRAADPARRAGQRLREAADAVRSGARRGCPRPSEHQAGHAAVRPRHADARFHVLPQLSRWART